MIVATRVTANTTVERTAVTSPMGTIIAERTVDINLMGIITVMAMAYVLLKHQLHNDFIDFPRLDDHATVADTSDDSLCAVLVRGGFSRPSSQRAVLARHE